MPNHIVCNEECGRKLTYYRWQGNAFSLEALAPTRGCEVRGEVDIDAEYSPRGRFPRPLRHSRSELPLFR